MAGAAGWLLLLLQAGCCCGLLLLLLADCPCCCFFLKLKADSPWRSCGLSITRPEKGITGKGSGRVGASPRREPEESGGRERERKERRREEGEKEKESPVVRCGD